MHFRVLEIQIRLVRKKTVPEIRLGHVVPGPVGDLHVLEDDARVLVFLRRVAPDVKIAPAAAGLGAARALKPRMLVGRVVQHQFGDDAQPAPVRLAQKGFEIAQRAVHRMHVAIIGDVVAVVLERRRIKRQQPDRRHAEVLDVIQLFASARENRPRRRRRVVKRADMHFVNDAALIPERLLARPARLRFE